MLSIPGIGPVFAVGILSEISDINLFNNESALAKYIYHIWKEYQSRDFSFDTTRLAESGNTYLRYYNCEATTSVIFCKTKYHNFYPKKYNECTIHKYARAIVLITRKVVRLIYGLMSKDKLYNQNKQ